MSRTLLRSSGQSLSDMDKVNAALKSHFEKVGQTMSKEWASKAGSRGQTVLSKY